jgi:hypothetical protein
MKSIKNLISNIYNMILDLKNQLNNFINSFTYNSLIISNKQKIFIILTNILTKNLTSMFTKIKLFIKGLIKPLIILLMLISIFYTFHLYNIAVIEFFSEYIKSIKEYLFPSNLDEIYRIYNIDKKIDQSELKKLIREKMEKSSQVVKQIREALATLAKENSSIHDNSSIYDNSSFLSNKKFLIGLGIGSVIVLCITSYFFIPVVQEAVHITSSHFSDIFYIFNAFTKLFYSTRPSSGVDPSEAVEELQELIKTISPEVFTSHKSNVFEIFQDEKEGKVKSHSNIYRNTGVRYYFEKELGLWIPGSSLHYYNIDSKKVFPRNLIEEAFRGLHHPLELLYSDTHKLFSDFEVSSDGKSIVRKGSENSKEKVSEVIEILSKEKESSFNSTQSLNIQPCSYFTLNLGSSTEIIRIDFSHVSQFFKNTWNNYQIIMYQQVEDYITTRHSECQELLQVLYVDSQIVGKENKVKEILDVMHCLEIKLEALTELKKGLIVELFDVFSEQAQQTQQVSFDSTQSLTVQPSYNFILTLTSNLNSYVDSVIIDFSKVDPSIKNTVTNYDRIVYDVLENHLTNKIKEFSTLLISVSADSDINIREQKRLLDLIKLLTEEKEQIVEDKKYLSLECCDVSPTGSEIFSEQAQQTQQVSFDSTQSLTVQPSYNFILTLEESQIETIRIDFTKIDPSIKNTETNYKLITYEQIACHLTHRINEYSSLWKSLQADSDNINLREQQRIWLSLNILRNERDEIIDLKNELIEKHWTVV